MFVNILYYIYVNILYVFYTTLAYTPIPTYSDRLGRVDVLSVSTSYFKQMYPWRCFPVLRAARAWFLRLWFLRFYVFIKIYVPNKCFTP